MKKKTDDNDVVTNEYFREAKDKFRDEMASLIDRSEERVTRNLKIYIQDTVVSKLDWIVGEIQTMRQEQTIANQHFDDLQGQVETNEKRVKKLEETVKN